MAHHDSSTKAHNGSAKRYVQPVEHGTLMWNIFSFGEIFGPYEVLSNSMLTPSLLQLLEIQILLLFGTFKVECQVVQVIKGFGVLEIFEVLKR